MANFGTYEGHRILSDAMDKAISETARAQEFNERKRQFDIAQKLDRDRYEENQRQFDESHGLDTDRFGLDQDRTYHGMMDKDRHFDVHSDKTYHGMGIDDRRMTDTERNSAVSRDYTDSQTVGIDFKNRDNEEGYQRNKKKEEIKRKAYDNRSLANQITVTDANGNVSFKPNASQIISDWNSDFDMNDILAQDTDGILTDADRQEIQQSLVNPGIDDILQLQKAFVNEDAGAIDMLLDSNPQLKTQILHHGINTGNPIKEGQTVGEYIKNANFGSTPDDALGISNTAGGWGSKKFIDVVDEQKDWGGNIQFKGLSKGNRTEKRHASILIDALKESKNNETSGLLYGGDWTGDRSDDIFLEQTANGWTVTEDDFGHNDTYDARVKNGVAEVNVNGKWVPLAGMKSSDWE